MLYITLLTFLLGVAIFIPVLFFVLNRDAKFNKAKIAEISPPSEITILEGGYLRYNSVNIKTLTATLLYLATKGIVGVEISSSSPFTFSFHEIEKNTQNISESDVLLHELVLGKKDSIQELEKQIKKDLRSKKITFKGVKKQSALWTWIIASPVALLILIVVVGSMLDALHINSDFLGALAVPLFLTSIIVGIAAIPLLFFFKATRGKKARELREYIIGLKVYFDKTDYYNKDFVNIIERIQNNDQKHKLIITDALFPWAVLLREDNKYSRFTFD